MCIEKIRVAFSVTEISGWLAFRITSTKLSSKLLAVVQTDLLKCRWNDGLMFQHGLNMDIFLQLPSVLMYNYNYNLYPARAAQLCTREFLCLRGEVGYRIYEVRFSAQQYLWTHKKLTNIDSSNSFITALSQNGETY